MSCTSFSFCSTTWSLVSSRSVTSIVNGIRPMRSLKTSSWHMNNRSTMTSTLVRPSGVVKYIWRWPCITLNRRSPRNPRPSRKPMTSFFAVDTDAKSMSWSLRTRGG